jgi:hypothetical protein
VPRKPTVFAARVVAQAQFAGGGAAEVRVFFPAHGGAQQQLIGQLVFERRAYSAMLWRLSSTAVAGRVAGEALGAGGRDAAGLVADHDRRVVGAAVLVGDRIAGLDLHSRRGGIRSRWRRRAAAAHRLSGPRRSALTVVWRNFSLPVSASSGDSA